MTKKTIDQLKYPIGQPNYPEQYNIELVHTYTKYIRSFPERLSNQVHILKTEELDFQYRPDGWSIRQVIHHLADSHMNCFIRFKLSLTEDYPTIKPYDETKWAILEDGHAHPIKDSLSIIEGVHRRWSTMLSTMDEADYQKGFVHPESKRRYTLLQATALYEWHCKHHYAHIEQALEHKGSFDI